MDSITQLSEYFKKFPGIGERQARRFVYFILRMNKSYSYELIDLIKKVKENTAQCNACYRYFPSNAGGFSVCDICSNPNTDKSILAIIEKDADLSPIRSSGYKGSHFILGGLAPLMERTGHNIRLKELIKTIETRLVDANPPLKEIIIAMSLSPQGEHTDFFIRETLAPLQSKYQFKISSLGRGISTGTELEYVDSDTIRNALKNRA